MKMAEHEHSLSIEGLELRTHAGRQSHLLLPGGMITVILGQNGSGKTSFIEKLTGLRYPDGLRVSYGKEQLWHTSGNKQKLNEDALRAYGYACQAPEEQLIMRTVEAELRSVMRPYSLPEAEIQTRMTAALESVGLSNAWFMRNPLQLSGGERRKVALAGLFAIPSNWLLLDEPTAGLDAYAHELLRSKLLACKAGGQGILMISHDSDWAVPMADYILVMKPDGSLYGCTKNELIQHPEILTECGLHVPEWLQFAYMMNQAGVAAEDVWEPSRLADAIAERLQTGSESSIPLGAASVSYANASMELAVERNPDKGIDDRIVSRQRKREAKSRLSGFDPRSVWASYVLLSTGIMLQQSWLGVTICILLTAIVIKAALIPLGRWRGAIRAIITFSLVTSVLAGVGLSAAGFTWDNGAFLNTVRSLTKPLLAMLLGLGLPLVMTPLRLRRSLEQLFAIRGRLVRWTQNLVLVITLLLRFIPVLVFEWERFSRLAAARGKQSRLSWRKAPAMIRDTALPFMLSLFKLAEEAAAALESRGVGRRPYPVVRKTEYWQAKDYLITVGSLLLLVLLWLLARR